MTQVETLAEALDNGARLTVLTALRDFGVFALSQRMTDLRRIGYPVESRTIKLPNGKHVSEYFKGGIAHG